MGSWVIQQLKERSWDYKYKCKKEKNAGREQRLPARASVCLNAATGTRCSHSHGRCGDFHAGDFHGAHDRVNDRALELQVAFQIISRHLPRAAETLATMFLMNARVGFGRTRSGTGAPVDKCVPWATLAVIRSLFQTPPSAGPDVAPGTTAGSPSPVSPAHCGSAALCGLTRMAP